MRITVTKKHCDGCVWLKSSKKDKVLFCPFVRCVQRYGFTLDGDES